VKPGTGFGRHEQNAAAENRPLTIPFFPRGVVLFAGRDAGGFLRRLMLVAALNQRLTAATRVRDTFGKPVGFPLFKTKVKPHEHF